MEHPQCKPSCFNIFGISLGAGYILQLLPKSGHRKEECAFQSVQGNTPLSSQGPSQPSSRQSPSHKMWLETLEMICTSWNKGRCAYPGTCTFKHTCATCQRFGHRARDCADTPIHQNTSRALVIVFPRRTSPTIILRPRLSTWPELHCLMHYLLGYLSLMLLLVIHSCNSSQTVQLN